MEVFTAGGACASERASSAAGRVSRVGGWRHDTSRQGLACPAGYARPCHAEPCLGYSDRCCSDTKLLTPFQAPAAVPRSPSNAPHRASVRSKVPCSARSASSSSSSSSSTSTTTTTSLPEARRCWRRMELPLGGPHPATTQVAEEKVPTELSPASLASRQWPPPMAIYRRPPGCRSGLEPPPTPPAAQLELQASQSQSTVFFLGPERLQVFAHQHRPIHLPAH